MVTRNAQSSEEKKYVITFFFFHDISIHSESSVKTWGIQKAFDNFKIPNPLIMYTALELINQDKDSYYLG